MSDSSHHEELELFDRVLDLGPEQREAFLVEACRDQPELERRVRHLLRAHERAQGFLESPAAAELIGDADVPNEPDRIGIAPGTRIATYKVQSLVGFGGMGTVYEAIQDQPHRKVALKILNSGLDSPSARRRFHYESEILAELRHPGIAQVHEAGTHRIGEGPAAREMPYFAMEYIEGAANFIEHARSAALDVRERLELFREVCAAVHHGHLHGVIHRDLKPANILVDASGNPKLIDFGIARSEELRAHGSVTQTRVGEILGTLEYMSPEQVGGSRVDARTDVYALGVILFELLTGRRPQDLRGKTLFEASRVILEQPAPRPSSLRPDLRDDLDWIVLKSLEKDLDLRYRSVSELDEDVRRVLANEPVLAGPASARYRFVKFLRRHKLTAGLVAALMITLLIGIVGTAMGWRAAVRSQRETESARQRVVREAERTALINDFLTRHLLPAANPWERGQSVTIETLLADAAKALEGRFPDDPDVEAELRTTLGRTYTGLGDYTQAARHHERAHELRRTHLGARHPVTLQSRSALANSYENQGQLKKAERLHREIWSLQRKILGEHHVETLSSQTYLATTLLKLNRFEEAEPLFLQAIERLPEDFKVTVPFLYPLNNLAIIYARQGRFAEAEPLMTRVLEAKRRLLGEEHPTTLVTMNNLASMHVNQDHLDQAFPIYEKVLEVRRRVLGDDHPSTLSTQANIALLYSRSKQYDESKTRLLETLTALRRVRGEEHPKTLECENTLAVLYEETGHLDKAEEIHARVLEIRRRVLGDDHLDTLSSMNGLGWVYTEQGRLAEAEGLLTVVLETRRRLLGNEHRHTLLSVHNAARLQSARGNPSKAEPLYREAYDGRRGLLGEEHENALSSLRGLLEALTRLHRVEEARTLAGRYLAGYRAAEGPEHEDTRRAIERLGLGAPPK